jgi:hypothetical protein
LTEDSVLTSAFNVLDDGLQLAGFQVTPTGRFWVTPEDSRTGTLGFSGEMMGRVWTAIVAFGNLAERLPYSVHLFLVAIQPKCLKILGCITRASNDKTGAFE